MIYTISGERLSAEINSFGAELSSLKLDGVEYMWVGEAWPSHAPLLFPICGRLAGGKYEYGGKEYELCIHGFLKFSEFKLEEATASRVVFSLTESEETLATYPFRFKVYAIYEIKDDTLHFDFKVENRDKKPMPHMFGWHPGFELWGEGDISDFGIDFGRTDGLTHHILTPAKFVSGMIEAFPVEGGKYKLCEEELYSQDTLIFSDTENEIRLYREGDERAVELRWSDNLPYLAVWKLPKSEARYICLEPWSGVPGDGVSKEVLEKKVVNILPSGESTTYSYTVKCK